MANRGWIRVKNWIAQDERRKIAFCKGFVKGYKIALKGGIYDEEYLKTVRLKTGGGKCLYGKRKPPAIYREIRIIDLAKKLEEKERILRMEGLL